MQEAFTRAAARWPVDGVPAEPAAWVIATAGNVALDRLRRDRTLALKLPQLEQPGSEPAPDAPRRPPARRPPRADLRLLSPGPRVRCPGRADAAARRRPLDAGDRARLPRVGARHGAAARAREAAPAGGRHRASRLARAGHPGASRPGDGGAVPDLQRGLLGLVRRRARPPGAVRRGDPPRPRAREPAAGRAGAGWARRAHALPSCPGARADWGRRRADPARRPGPAVVGRRHDRPGRGGAPRRRRRGMGRRLLPSGGDLTRARPGRLRRRHRLAGDRRALRRPRRGGAVAGGRAEPGGGGVDGRGARAGARAPRPPGARGGARRATTCCRRPGPTCSAGSGAPPRRWPSTGARSSSRPGRPTGRSSLAAAPSCRPTKLSPWRARSRRSAGSWA